jgi:antitoxin YefM
MVMHVVSYSEARDNLKGVIDRAVEDADVTIITRRGSSNAVLLSQDLFDSLMETVHLLRSPANAAHLAQSIAQDQAGQTCPGGLSDA